MRAFVSAVAVFAWGALLLGEPACAFGDAADKSPEIDFQKEIWPIVKAKCLRCHNEKQKKGKLDMSSRAAMLKGGDSGPAFVPGDSEESLMIELVYFDEMPPKDEKPRITKEELKKLSAWVDAGAPVGKETPKEEKSGHSGWKQTEAIPAPEAFQAAAADERFAYAIANRMIARYDRQSGERVAVSRGDAEHLNSGFLQGGKLYCAHSNYPKKPEQSEVKVLDLDTMELSTFHDFGAAPYGSLTWAIRHADSWWCTFAHYGDENHRTQFVQFDDEWQVQGRWKFPPEVVSDLGRYSVSGGIWQEGLLCVTGHDKQVIYRLRLPEQGDVLHYVDTVEAPFTGQGIAHDPKTGGLVGIHRAKRQILFAEPR